MFKGILQDFPQGEILAGEQQECPDIVVATGRGQIGIEVTRICTEERKRDESEVEAAIAEAQNIYEGLTLPNLHVSVHVGDGKTFSRKNRKKFATAIANLVSRNIPAQDGLVEIENDWNNPDVFPFEINSIHICRLAKSTYSHWYRPDACFLPTEFKENLQKIISGRTSC